MKQTVIYLRTSTEEQNPLNQLEDCKQLAIKLNLNDYQVFEEKVSAFKDNVERKQFNLIKKAIQQGQVKNLIVWDLDRLYRNRIKCVNFIRNYSKLGLKIYSFRQQWLMDIENIPEPFNEMFMDFMIQFLGWIAEEESLKKSERVRIAVRKHKGITKSYKGKKWGRKPILNQALKQQALELKESGLSIRKIAKELNISPSSVFKLVN